MKLKMFLVLALGLVLSACATTAPSTTPTPQGVTIHQRYEQACVAGGESYAVIASVNKVHRLSASQQHAVLVAKQQIDLRCHLAPGQDYPYTATQAVMDELEGAAGTLTAIKQGVQ